MSRALKKLSMCIALDCGALGVSLSGSRGACRKRRKRSCHVDWTVMCDSPTTPYYPCGVKVAGLTIKYALSCTARRGSIVARERQSQREDKTSILLKQIMRPYSNRLVNQKHFSYQTLRMPIPNTLW